MKQYTIVRRPEQLDWDQIPALQINELYNTEPVDIKAEARLCYDDEAIYVHLQAVEQNISAKYTGILDEVSEDSCLEFFFSPIEGDTRYFNIEVNPNGAMYLGFGPSIQGLCRLIPEYPEIFPKAEYTEDGWKVTYAVPHSFVRRFFPAYSPAPGKSIKANCYKCGSLKEPVHYMCWCPVVPQKCAFHNPSRFGTMYFG
ncbi:MAG: carbohydrate-binding family 9-like protein [Oscillospiraceae bacterium]|nr:carbohydrate-binding family 9-like protein [Oscillospiraceae bacterium]